MGDMADDVYESCVEVWLDGNAPGSMDRIPVAFESIEAETPEAWLLLLDDGRRIWLPKSQCRLFTETVEVPLWLAEEKELPFESPL